MKLAVLLVHGMGSQQEDFAEILINDLTRGLGDKANNVCFLPCWWSPVLSQHQQSVWQKVVRNKKMKLVAWRKQILTILGDPVSYLSSYYKPDKKDYNEIHLSIRDSLGHLNQLTGKHGKVPLMILAHSLGSVIVSNYLWDEQTGRGVGRNAFERCDTLVKLITFGSTIPLFLPPGKSTKCIEFPTHNLGKRFRKTAAWTNVFGRFDLLGFPIEGIWDDNSGTQINDVSIDPGNICKAFTPFCHTEYTRDTTFQLIVTNQILEILSVL
jgi:hypothetical protein